MKILLLGAHGQLGGALSHILPADALRWGRGELNLQHEEEIVSRVTAAHPDIVLNAAAMTDVDACEHDPARAAMVNAEGPRALAKACKEINAPLIHISTDYVFGADEGRHSPYRESDTRGPVNVYGKTKLDGETRIAESGCEYLIVRVCGLYGGQRTKPNFVDRIIEQSKKREIIQLTFDQIYSPTFVGELAPALLRLIGEEQRGIIHLANTEPVSRYEFTRAILDILGSSTALKNDSAKFQGVPRPKYSALDSGRIALKEYMNSWRDALKRYLSSL